MVGTTLGGHAGRRAAVRGPRLVGAFLACAVAPTAQPASGQPGAEIAETAEVFTLGLDGDLHFQRIKSVSISLPEGFSPMAGNDSLLAGVVVDELDQSGLRVLRVSVPGMGVRGR